jgi:hypothetical protein
VAAFRREPVAVIVSAADAAVIGVLTALVALDVISLSGEQLASISAAIIAVSGFVGVLLRRNVVSPETYELDVVEALYSPIPDDGRDDL